MLSKDTKRKIISEFGKNAKDAGSAEVQIALLSKDIEALSEHFKKHKKDHSSKRGMYKMIGTRRRLLRYLQRTNLDSYRELIKKLELRK